MRARHQPPGRARRQPPHRGRDPAARRAQRRQVRGRLVELRRHPARGLPAPGRHLRLRERRPRARASTARRATRASTCARSSPTWSACPARAEVSATVGGQQIRFTPATIAGARLPACSAGSAAIASPRLWSPEDPHLYTVELEVSLDGQVVQRYTQQTGIRSIERDEHGRMLLNGRQSDAARREPARGGPDARRRAAARRHPRELLAAARAGREHDALALSDAPARARAGGPLRDRRVVRGARLPDARPAVPQRRGAPARGAARCATW